MSISNCTVSFTRNDLQKTRVLKGKCPVKDCRVNIQSHKVPFQRYRGEMKYLPFCPEHGIRIHSQNFVYYNGPQKERLITATKRNLPFNNNYYVSNFLQKGAKMESGRLCYENSEDAVSYNVFSELLSYMPSLEKLTQHITRKEIKGDVELYLWGGKIDLKNNRFSPYKPLIDMRKHLEGDIKMFGTEPDIMLVVPKQAVICIEAKFGSKNPIAKESKVQVGEKPKAIDGLIERYCTKNKVINADTIFDFSKMPPLFYEQLFRNIVFAASMAKLADAPCWHVVNLRNQHIMNVKQGKPESAPIMRNMRSILRPAYKKRFSHLTWENIYDIAIKDVASLSNLAWYLKTKSINCGRAFNIF